MLGQHGRGYMIEIFERLALQNDMGLLWSALAVVAMYILLRRNGGNGNRRAD